MTKAQPAKLGSTIVVKGQAKPVSLTEAASTSEPSTADLALERAEVIQSSSKNFQSEPADQSVTMNLATKSMTVKVDIATYKKLKSHGIAVDKSSQDIFVAALALYFQTKKI